MSRLFFAVLLWVYGSLPAFALGPIPFEELTYRGVARPFFGEPATPIHGQLLEMVRKSRFTERMVQLTTSTTRLKSDLSIGFTSCGRISAFYDPSHKKIVFCLELMEVLAEQAKLDKDGIMKMDRTAFAQTIEGVIWGIFFHELGHAVISINGVPITGREEDVADQFGLYYAVNYMEPQNVPVVLPTIWFFTQLAKRADMASSSQETLKRLLADEHSLSEQRIFNLACWAYGSNTNRGVDAANFVALPRERGDRCQKEYATLDYGIKVRFKRYFKTK